MASCSCVENTYLPHGCEGAAMFLAALAYPENLQKRDEFLKSAKALLWKRWINAAGSGKERTARRAEAGAERAVTNEKIDGRFRHLQARLERRLMAVHFFNVLVLRRVVEPDYKVWFVAMDVADKGMGFSPHYPDVLRVLTSSVSVLHLAIGLAVSALPPAKDSTIPGVVDLIVEPKWLGRALQIAEACRLRVLPHALSEYDPRNAVRLVLQTADRASRN